MSNSDKQYDAIVVGSGISGGWAAKELCEKGLRVLLLERGRDIQHGLDYLGEHAPPWKVPFANKADRKPYKDDYPVQSKCYAFDAATKDFFNKDSEAPYQQDPEKPYEWIRANGVGGRSLIWGRQTYRWSEFDFKANSQDGHGCEWPIGYDDIKDWYSYVERFVGISGAKEGLTELPDSEFLPPMGMYAIEKTIKGRLKKHMPEVTMTMGRTAILSENHNGRAACHYCGPCPRGCSTGSYFSSQSSTLPAARATGNLTLRPYSVVEKLEYDARENRVSAVHVIDAESRERLSFSADLVFLCASTLASTQILLNSKSEQFPSGLANSSGTLGHYLMDHFKMQHMAVFADNIDHYYKGFRPTGSYIPRFKNLPGKEKTNYLRGFGVQADPVRPDWRFHFNQKGFGKSLKDKLRKPAPFWIWVLGAFGECLPDYNNKVSLDENNLDAFGIPQIKVSMSFGDNEHKMAEDIIRSGEKIFKAAGAVYIETTDKVSVPGSAIHEMGTARMGKDPKTSVLNKWNQSHDVPNLFVTDGACMTSSSCVNPSLTYMALTARACDYAVKQWRQGHI
ncbi:GMC oxidoreductase [Pseudoteredinibacter isoporae]|uniref:Choline dehydrogenase-like flavoprotein n=1 Tax=Pseudoteredinibacter isoporae TaxID=570281 RepID=A0A7X0MX00_9GAMM|nr:GMC family oxidoreductase [Pseudoteredinibacter isoporae]MBB6520367.1 choline dehydrogenase-like flavoprotein [Pseudoteredinibacter isoporae]NHO85937.1 GMC family oxidoreductase [Pseudoteredinibacter isoporae]NIB25611.1 GMC family oxidoreductase [Pseudoteredinibacter isoporae]